MSDYAEKISEVSISAGGTGREDYKKDFRHLAEIDQTFLELPYRVYSYWDVSNSTLDAYQTKAREVLPAEWTGKADAFRAVNRYLLYMNYRVFGYEALWKKHMERIGEGMRARVYYKLNSTEYEIIDKIFGSENPAHRVMNWTAQPSVVFHLRPPQITKIPAGAELWYDLSNYTEEFIPYPYLLTVLISEVPSWSW